MNKNIFDIGYVNEEYLKEIGIKSVGNNVLISRNCLIVGIENISIGNDVRIDSYTSLIASGKEGLDIGSNIHIGCYCLLSSSHGIELCDFSGLSHGVKIFSASDDYSGQSLTNPTVPEEFANVHSGKVKLCRHVIIGSNSVILPNLTIGEGSSVGALSLVTKSLDEWGMYFGSPTRRIKSRSKKLLEREKEYLLQRDSG